MAYHPGNVGVVRVALGHPHVVKKVFTSTQFACIRHSQTAILFLPELTDNSEFRNLYCKSEIILV